MTSGTYLEIDGRPALRFERAYVHPVERVWTLITDPDELAHWFPARVAFDALETGAAIRFTFDHDPTPTVGRVLAVDRPRQLGLDWEGDELWFDLEAHEGGTRLTFTTLLVARETAARNAAGWEMCLDALVDGHATSPGDWRPRYDAYLDAGLPSGAPIPALD